MIVNMYFENTTSISIAQQHVVQKALQPIQNLKQKYSWHSKISLFLSATGLLLWTNSPFIANIFTESSTDRLGISKLFKQFMTEMTTSSFLTLPLVHFLWFWNGIEWINAHLSL